MRNHERTPVSWKLCQNRGVLPQEGQVPKPERRIGPDQPTVIAHFIETVDLKLEILRPEPRIEVIARVVGGNHAGPGHGYFGRDGLVGVIEGVDSRVVREGLYFIDTAKVGCHKGDSVQEARRVGAAAGSDAP